MNLNRPQKKILEADIDMKLHRDALVQCIHFPTLVSIKNEDPHEQNSSLRSLKEVDVGQIKGKTTLHSRWSSEGAKILKRRYRI